MKSTEAIQNSGIHWKNTAFTPSISNQIWSRNRKGPFHRFPFPSLDFFSHFGGGQLIFFSFFPSLFALTNVFYLFRSLGLCNWTFNTSGDMCSNWSTTCGRMCFTFHTFSHFSLSVGFLLIGCEEEVDDVWKGWIGRNWIECCLAEEGSGRGVGQKKDFLVAERFHAKKTRCFVSLFIFGRQTHCMIPVWRDKSRLHSKSTYLVASNS